MGDEDKRSVGRPKNIPPLTAGGGDEVTFALSGPPDDALSQAETNILLNNLRAMDEFGNLLQLSCKLLRHKDHLARQVDRLERHLTDLRTKIEQEQRRFDTLVGARRELVTG